MLQSVGAGSSERGNVVFLLTEWRTPQCENPVCRRGNAQASTVTCSTGGLFHLTPFSLTSCVSMLRVSHSTRPGERLGCTCFSATSATLSSTGRERVCLSFTGSRSPSLRSVPDTHPTLQIPSPLRKSPFTLSLPSLFPPSLSPSLSGDVKPNCEFQVHTNPPSCDSHVI